MTDQTNHNPEMEEDIVGDDADTPEENNSEEEENNDNSSNFKKLRKAYRWALAKLKEYESKEKGWDKEPPEDEVKSESKQELDLRLYFIENPEAKEYKEKITELLEEYPNMSKERALILAKQETPQQSKDKEDFNLNSSNPNAKKKDLKDLSEEEALELPNKQYLDWVRANWKNI